MIKCKNCNEQIQDGTLFGCKNCDTKFCEKCADKTLRICPNCYSDLEIMG